MPCSFGLLHHPSPGADAQPNGLLRVTVTDRSVPLVTAAYGMWVARPVRTTALAPGRYAPARLLGEAPPRWPPPRGREPGGLAAVGGESSPHQGSPSLKVDDAGPRRRGERQRGSPDFSRARGGDVIRSALVDSASWISAAFRLSIPSKSR
jgi:hypothetical protein